LISLYGGMVLTRAFDAKAIALQRTGKIGTFASALGQEAVGVGTASAMRPDDVLVPSYRDHAAPVVSRSRGPVVRGVTMTESLLYWGGDERGSDFSGPRGCASANHRVLAKGPMADPASCTYESS
jgi:pyruvate dehydrogenase E1 component alpha subunit